ASAWTKCRSEGPSPITLRSRSMNTQFRRTADPTQWPLQGAFLIPPVLPVVLIGFRISPCTSLYIAYNYSKLLIASKGLTDGEGIRRQEGQDRRPAGGRSTAGLSLGCRHPRSSLRRSKSFLERRPIRPSRPPSPGVGSAG